MKINFDIAIMTRAFFTSVVCQNELGVVVFGHSNNFPPFAPVHGEAQAAFQAIKLVVFLKFHYVIFEGDSKNSNLSSIASTLIPLPGF